MLLCSLALALRLMASERMRLGGRGCLGVSLQLIANWAVNLAGRRETDRQRQTDRFRFAGGDRVGTTLGRRYRYESR